MNAVYPSLVLAVFVFITLQFLRLCCRAFVAGVHRAADRWRVGPNWSKGQFHEPDRGSSPISCGADTHPDSSGLAMDTDVNFGTDATERAPTRDRSTPH